MENANKEFNYAEAVRELELIAAKVEDPSTGLSEIDACMKRSGELVKACRDYLRTAREKVVEFN